MIGKKIRQLRELKGYNQVNLSTEINISQKQLSRIEAGVVSPTYELMLKIVQVLNISLNELIDFDESLIFNNNSVNQQGGEFLAYNNTEIKQVQNLYERLLKEKDVVIKTLQQQFEIK